MALYFSRINAQKEESFFSGVKLLQLWLEKLLILGLYSNLNLEQSLNEISSRLVDCGLPGIARKLRRIPEVLSKEKDSLETVTPILGELYLFCRKVQHIHNLGDLEKEDLLTFAGIPFPKKYLQEEQSVTDHWIYLGLAQDKEEKMSVYRHWFYGRTCKSKCLFLEFKFGLWNKPIQFLLGKHYHAAVQFFPSMTPVRISDAPSRSFIHLPKETLESHTLRQSLDHFAWLLSHNPFLPNYIYVMRDIKLITENKDWYFSDGGDHCVMLDHQIPDIPKLMSLSDHPKCQFIAEFNGHRFKVLSVIVDGWFFSC